MENESSSKQSLIAIKATNLRKTFGQFTALNIESLTVYQGEMVGLLGPSGSGKSTLLRHLSGLTTADKNSHSKIDVLNQTIQSNGKLAFSVRAYRQYIGHIFQQFNLVNRLTVLDNVLIGSLSHTSNIRTLLKLFSNQQKKQALALLDRVGLLHLAHQRLSLLSGGQQQRVAIARALMQQSKIILADEPIASLDPESAKIVMNLLKEICQQDGVTVVVTLHQVDYAMAYCPRIVALKQGHIFYDGLAENLSALQIEQLYKQSVATSHELGDSANLVSLPCLEFGNL